MWTSVTCVITYPYVDLPLWILRAPWLSLPIQGPVCLVWGPAHSVCLSMSSLLAWLRHCCSVTVLGKTLPLPALPAPNLLDLLSILTQKISKHMKSRWFLLSMQSEPVRITEDTSTSQHSALKLSLACRSAENNPSADKKLVDISGLAESTAILLQSQELQWHVSCVF